MRLIDADRLYDENWNTLYYDNKDRDDIVPDLIDSQPTVEERHTAHWIKDKYGVCRCEHCLMPALEILTGCSINLHHEPELSNFCPNCGATMIKGDIKNETD